MELETIAQLISSVGFPIFSTIYLIYFMNTELKENRDATNNLSLLIQKLIDKLDGE